MKLMSRQTLQQDLRYGSMRKILSNIAYIKKKGFVTGDYIVSGYGIAVVVHAEAGAVRCRKGIIISNLYKYNWRKCDDWN